MVLMCPMVLLPKNFYILGGDSGSSGDSGGVSERTGLVGCDGSHYKLPKVQLFTSKGSTKDARASFSEHSEVCNGACGTLHSKKF